MNLVWHIVKKDFRRHRMPYGLWLCLLLAKQLVLGLAFSDWAADAEWFERLQLGDVVLSVMESGAAFLLVGSWVLEDPVVGSTQFWVTRPIAGGRLLCAKLLGVALGFVVLPVLIALPGWIACGLNGIGLMRQVAFACGTQLVLAVSAFVLGTLADRGNRFLVVLLGLTVAVVALGPVMAKLSGVFPETRALATTRVVVGSALIFVAVVGAVWLQFRYRRMVLGAIWLLMGVVLGMAAWSLFPFELSRGWRAKPPELVEARGMELTILGVQQSRVPYQSKLPPGQVWVEVLTAVKNAPAELLIGSAYGRFVFTTADGRRHEVERGMGLEKQQPGFDKIVRRALDLRGYAFAGDPETEVAIQQKLTAVRQRMREQRERQIATGTRVDEPRGAREPEIPILVARLALPLWVAEEIQAGRAELEMTADIKLEQARFAGDVPLGGQTSVLGNGFRARIVENQWSQQDSRDAVLVKIVTSVSALEITPVTQGLRFYAVNRGIGYKSDFWATKNSKGPFPLLGFSTVRLAMSIALPRVWRGDRWVTAPGVKNGLSLAAVAFDRVGAVRCTAQTEKLTWSGQRN